MLLKIATCRVPDARHCELEFFWSSKSGRSWVVESHAVVHGFSQGNTKVCAARLHHKGGYRYQQKQRWCKRSCTPICSSSSPSSGQECRILVSTGDVMGDIHGGKLISAILAEASERLINVQVYALGGSKMQEAGATLVGDNTGLSSIGLAEALPLVLPSLRLQARVRSFLKDKPPAIVVLIDYPGVNIPFGRYLKELYGCKVVFYIPPNEWLWNTSRTKTIVGMSDLILATYPGEAEYYARAGGTVKLVGHPLVDLVSQPYMSKKEAKLRLGLPESAVVVSLFPASRDQELRHVWPVVAAAARKLQDAWEFREFGRSGDFDVRFVVAVVSERHVAALEKGLEEHGLAEKAVLWLGDSLVAMAAADLAITKTGSVNLQLALLNVPQVALYRLDSFTAWLAQEIFRFDVKHVSLVNLIMDEKVIPEFVQDAATPEAVAEAALAILEERDGKTKQHILDGYTRLRGMLGDRGVAKRTAISILDQL